MSQVLANKGQNINLQKSFLSSGASKILSGMGEMYLVFLTEDGVTWL